MPSSADFPGLRKPPRPSRLALAIAGAAAIALVGSIGIWLAVAPQTPVPPEAEPVQPSPARTSPVPAPAPAPIVQPAPSSAGPLSPKRERALRPQESFRECTGGCPEMIVVSAGEFTMGSPATENGHVGNEGPQHTVVIARPFAVSKFDVTYADWDACVSAGGCPQVGDAGLGRDTKPVIDVTWDDAQHYVAWLAKTTGQPYRLLTEAEWEYAARAGAATAYSWGTEIGEGNANCIRCGSAWDNRETSPAGSFKPNAFGLYDMAGNVWQWVQDCYHDNYNGAPMGGSAWTSGDCSRRVARGGSWVDRPQLSRSASRLRLATGFRISNLGFRVGRTLNP
jgi:formylglycine-generating enzyme required for sulfatase activity